MKYNKTCTSAKHVDLELDLSIIALFDGLFKSDLLANEMSAITRVIIILQIDIFELNTEIIKRKELDTEKANVTFPRSGVLENQIKLFASYPSLRIL